MNHTRKNKRKRHTPLLLLCMLAGIYAFSHMPTTGGEQSAASSSLSVKNAAPTEISISEIDAKDVSGATNEDDTEDSKESTFELTMLDVGQGLSLLMESNGDYAIYDGGGRERSSYVVSYLTGHDVTSIKYMFVSHYDEDHIAGLIGVLHQIEVEQVICPDYEADSEIYASFVKALEQNGADIVHPSVGDEFVLGASTMQVIGPESYNQDQESNNNSIALRIVDGEFSGVLTGDAEQEEESAIVRSGLAVDSDLYVAGHHGSASSSGADFFNAISPEYVMISVGADNSYGHPAEETLNRIQASGAELFRTDVQGEVTCSTDGTEIWFSEDPTDDWSSGVLPLTLVPTEDGSDDSNGDTTGTREIVDEETDPEEDSGSNEATLSYILNTNTYKFHYPDCKSVRQMKDKNKKEYTGTRSEIMDMGYDPCGNCNP